MSFGKKSWFERVKRWMMVGLVGLTEWINALNLLVFLEI